MRIIAGEARGREILSIPKKLGEVRPISGRIRQSLFDILRPKVPGSRFLDLFAGTGAVGLEALSRGARKAVFIEKLPACLKVIERNIERLGYKKRAVALKGDATGALGWAAWQGGEGGFDIVFMGPPYVDPEGRAVFLVEGTLRRVAEAKLLDPRGWVVAQHHAKEKAPAPEGLEHFRSAKYGDTVLDFFRPAGSGSAHEPD